MSEFVESPDAERVAAVFYGVVLLALSVSLTVFVRYAFEQRRLVKDHIDNETVVVRRGPSYIAYVAAIAIAWFLPYVALFLYLAIGVYLTVPGRVIHRLLTRGRALPPADHAE